MALLLVFATVAQANDVKIEVQLSGAPEGRTETLLSGLSIVRQQNSARLSARHTQKLHEESAIELTQMLQVYGYYNVKITSKLQQINDDKWQADYQLELGEQVKLDEIVVTLDGQAKDDVEFKKFINNFPLKVADAFNHEIYEAAKKSLLRIGAERGYFDGQLTTHKVEVNKDDNTASIYLNYSSGDRYYFSGIQFPPTVLTNELLLRLTPIKAGEPYLASKVLKLRNNLTNSGYFDAVAVRTLIDERHDGNVALDVSLEPDARQRYTAGIGFGTDSGPRIGFGWENRYINKRGHRLSADSKFSQVTNSIAMDYKMPFWNETISDIGFNSEFKQQNTDTSESTSFAVGSYYKTKRWGWNETGALKLLNENYDVSQDSNTSLLLIPSISWARIWADDTIYTKHGGRLSLSLSGASESVLSDTTFGQAVVRGKFIHSFTENGRFITRGTLGVTEVTDFTKLPSSLRFFAGGDSSIRGFDFESLGPLGDDGLVEGGRYLAVGSVEYEQMIVGNWGAAIFSDFGNAMNSWDDPLEYSVGIGARWRSPIGLIRIDVAAGLSADNNPIGIHVVIGPDL
jgi:translocation and assembly module TamA